MEYKDVTDIVAGMHGVLDKIEARVRGSWVHRIFWHSVNVKWYTPPVLFGTSWELDHPFRRSRTVIVRYWWGRSLVLGFWSKTGYDEDHALLNATIHGRERTDGERLGWDDQSFAEAEFDGDSGPILERRPELRVRATVDDGIDGR